MEIVISEEVIKDSKSSFPEIVSLFFWRRRREAATIKVKENLTLGTRNSQRSDRSKSAYPSAPPWILVSEYKKTIEPEGSQRGEDKRWMTEIVSHAFHFSYSSNRIIVSFFFFFFLEFNLGKIGKNPFLPIRLRQKPSEKRRRRKKKNDPLHEDRSLSRR